MTPDKPKPKTPRPKPPKPKPGANRARGKAPASKRKPPAAPKRKAPAQRKPAKSATSAGATARRTRPRATSAKPGPKAKPKATKRAVASGTVPSQGLSKRGQRGLAAAIIALLAALAFLAFALTRGDDDERAAPIAPVALTAPELAQRAGDFDHPLYWTGPAAPDRYELSSTEEDRVFVRYLTPEARVGDGRPIFPTVGTYPVGDAGADLEAAAAESGTELRQREGYSLLVEDPTRVYVVFDEQPELELEVFDPRPGRALAAVQDGALAPVD